MNFDFGPDQYMFRDSLRAFLDDQWSPAKLRRLETGDGLDAELWAGLTALGLPAMLVPEAQGGLGLGFVDLALLLEEFGRALVPGPLVETLLATDAIVRFGAATQKAALLPAVAEGRCILTPATEAADGETVRAETAGGGWSLSGRMILVPYAAAAEFLLIAAQFGPAGTPGLALVKPHGPGVTLRPHTLLDFTSRAYEVVLDSAPIAPDDVLGGAPNPDAVQRLRDAGAMAAAAEMTGIAGKMLDLAVEYAKQRTQFGKPIASFQAIKHRCADMLAQVETSRTAAYYAAWALAAGSPDAARAVSMAKAFCGDATRFVCNETIQLHGGIGFAWEVDLHLFLRRAKALEYAFGDAAWHRERVISAALAARLAA